MNVASEILSRGHDDAVALFCSGSAVTYRQLRSQVSAVAQGLLERGRVKGERIGLWAENGPFFVAVYLGIIRAGMVAVPFQTEMHLDTFLRIVSQAAIKEVFVSNRFTGQASPWSEKAGLQIRREAEASGDSNEVLPLAEEHEPSQLAALMFTSGSTGQPKGVMITHRNIECNTLDIASYLGLTAADRVMVVLPFHYCFGLSLLHTHLFAGGSLVLNNQFKLFPESTLLEMQQTSCTGFAGVPSTYQLLLRKSRFRQLSFPALRWFQQAGGRLPDACIKEIIEAFPQVKFFLMYGQTEATARLSYLPPERLADKLGSVGRGLSSCKLEVLRPDGTPVKPDEPGEIVASGDNVSLGYWDDAQETAKFFKAGKLHTGDIGIIDGDGFIFLIEREREIIKSGGNRISAKEIEQIIAEIPQVIEVAVVGTPHELLGEAIKAFVVITPDSSVTPKDISDYCRRRLPAFKLPEEIIPLPHLPHNSAGKVLKGTLKDSLARACAGSWAPPGLLPQAAN